MPPETFMLSVLPHSVVFADAGEAPARERATRNRAVTTAATAAASWRGFMRDLGMGILSIERWERSHMRNADAGTFRN
ncbi:hypothetical protein GCM10022403_027290 [Streptomyces coacervatus]|uniref:Uncharacterized protein n=1 Tax=Streptomyces coacervatus TaxID=647381 RepID=A0ABP7HFU7_9ACTN